MMSSVPISLAMPPSSKSNNPPPTDDVLLDFEPIGVTFFADFFVESLEMWRMSSKLSETLQSVCKREMHEQLKLTPTGLYCLLLTQEDLSCPLS